MVQGVERPVDILRGHILYGKDRNERTVHREVHARLEPQIARQVHAALAHKARRAEKHRFAVDAPADAALFIKVDVLDRFAEAAVAGEQIVEQAAQPTLGRMRHCGGVGDDLAAFLAEGLESAERDRSRRENVAVGQNDTVAAANGVRAEKARHGAAALGQSRGDALQGQRADHRKGQQIRACKQHREVPRKQQVLLCLQR